MNFEIFQDADSLPKTEGVFNLLDKNGYCLFVGVSENIKLEVKKTLSKNEFLKVQTFQIETINGVEKDLIKLYAQTIRRKNPLYNFALGGQNLYPHLKITREKFPRLLATRRIEDDDEADYFGAFLPEIGVRFLLGFLIDTFGLRGCDIPIDGNFAVPCPQYFPVISAVKPPQKHNEISHFLFIDNQSIGYKKNSEAFLILLKLRDEAHSLANYVHRTKRETAHFYEAFRVLSFLSEKERYFLLRKFGSLSELKKAAEDDLIESLGTEKGKAIFRRLQYRRQSAGEPFIVPIRYDDPNGAAADLQPIFLRGENFGKMREN